MDFNAELIVDVLYIDGNPVLHVVDNATSFQAAKFLRNMEAKTVWEALQLCWLNTYTGPPDIIVHDAGTNFTAKEFRQSASAMSITVKQVPVEAHNSIGKVERYHAPLRRAYHIIHTEMPQESPELCLSMAVKAINDTAGPNGLVPTLLVFGTYPRMSETSSPSPGIIARATAIRKAMKELSNLRAQRQVKDALAMRNGPNVTPTLQLSPNDDAIVWRENGGWTGPFKILSIDDTTATIDMPYGPTNFRTTVVKPYHRDETTDISAAPLDVTNPPDVEDENNDSDYEPTADITVKRGRGRPKGSKNKPKTTPATMNGPATETFLSAKEEQDRKLSLALRQQGKITTPGEPFEASDKAEIDGLIDNDVFRFEQYDSTVHKAQIFKSRLVREVKGKETDTPYEKSRLVVQGFGDNGKGVVLTQAPTIQRASQRLIMALAPALMSKDASLWLRDITQAYVQSTTKLNRTILARLPIQLQQRYPPDTIMVVIKPLYGIAEAGTHWWATYSQHHKERLGMVTSTYDPCLMVTDNGPLGIVGMQTDDTIILGDKTFNERESQEMTFKCKVKTELKKGTALTFNGCIVTRSDDNVVIVKQKAQGNKLLLVDTTRDIKQQYLEQRARGAYLASICQPEAAFDLAIAAQAIAPSVEDAMTLNKRIRWQMHNTDRGLRYIPLTLEDVKLFVFVDGSFAGNKDLSSQIGYIIVLGNEVTDDNRFTLSGNIVHWSSTKCKRITRSVLASEIYGMANGVDIGFAITATVNMIMKQINLPPIPLVVCTDSYSLYECIVKLGTTREKRLMIDIMALREMYERRELVDMRWISGNSNPADAMTKGSPNKAMEKLIDDNQLTVNVEGWVQRLPESGHKREESMLD
jgi:hypothetical protein